MNKLQKENIKLLFDSYYEISKGDLEVYFEEQEKGYNEKYLVWGGEYSIFSSTTNKWGVRLYQLFDNSPLIHEKYLVPIKQVDYCKFKINQQVRFNFSNLSDEDYDYLKLLFSNELKNEKLRIKHVINNYYVILDNPKMSFWFRWHDLLPVELSPFVKAVFPGF